MGNINRKQFIKTVGLGGIMMGAGKIIGNTNIQEDPKLDAKVVAEFVGAGHKDFEKVKALLEEYPTLLNAAHDWKHGDFETCLGAASHVGYKELASWLIEQGAQANIFTAALFGKIDIIAPMLNAFPKALNAKGPHGYTLLHHTIRGGEEALVVKEYLESLGARETKIPLYKS